MRKQFRTTVAIALTLGGLTVAGCGGGRQQSTANGDVGSAGSSAAPAAEPHHSKLAGAAVGAVVGHELGHHAVAGAAVGALVQHHRNKKSHY
jgi:hypothetical protein